MRSVVAIAIGLGIIANSNPGYAEECELDGSVTERYIPVELYLGADWDGQETIRFPEIDKEQTKVDSSGNVLTSHGKVRVNGPVKWTDPATGKKLTAYERWTPQKDGGQTKELIGLTDNQDAIGRYWDERWKK